MSDGTVNGLSLLVLSVFYQCFFCFRLDVICLFYLFQTHLPPRYQVRELAKCFKLPTQNYVPVSFNSKWAVLIKTSPLYCTAMAGTLHRNNAYMYLV